MTVVPEISVIVSTFERPTELARVLEGYRHQSFHEFEVVVADDGSGPATAEVIESYRTLLGKIPLVHARHEHDGFRAAAARNMGVRASSGRWLVFADGDCVPFPDFLAEHARARDEACFLAGDRYLLEEDEARAVTVESVRSGAAFANAPTREKRRLRNLAAKNALYGWTRLKPDRPKLLTSNVSLSREAFFSVNGLDERFRGWGREDDDLRRRLVRRGARPRSVVGRANLLHLWHPPVASFKGRVRHGPNEPYFQRGFLLARCRAGLERRPLASVAFAIVSTDAALAAAVRRAIRGEGGAREPLPDDAVEVELLVDPQGSSPVPHFRRDAEVRVVVQPGPPETMRVARAHVLLHGRSSPAGAPASLCHAACLESDALDDAALARVARILDELI
jgi:glycosyltransferase involved in cell wall biosynthesis